jgi:hypothetical protein
MKYKFGVWNHNTEVTQKWSNAQYFINNREIKFNQNQIYPLKILDSQRNITIILVIYALCDLSYNNQQSYFNIKQIYDMIDKKFTFYKILLETKGLHILERICKKKYIRANKGFDYDKDFEKQKTLLTNKIRGLYVRSKDKTEQGNNIRMDDVYNAISLLIPVLISFRSCKKSESNYETYKKTNTLFGLNSDGKKLMKLYKEKGYLL